MKTKRLVSAILLGVSVLGLLFLGTIFRFKIDLNSDVLYASELIQSLVSNPLSLEQWRLTPAPAIFPDLVLYLGAMQFLGQARDQIFAVSYAQWILLLAGLAFLAKTLVPRIGLRGWLLVVGAFTLLTLTLLSSDFWLLFYSTNNHFASVLMPIFQLALVIRVLRSPAIKPWLIACIGILSLLANSSTQVYLLTFIVPACVAFLFIAVVRRGTKSNGSLYIIAISIAVGSALGSFILKVVLYNDPLAGRGGFSEGNVIRAISNLIAAIKLLLKNPSPFVSLSIGVFFAAIIYLLIAYLRSIRTQPVEGNPKSQQLNLIITNPTGPVAAFALLSLASSIAGGILLGGIADPYGLRYAALGMILVPFTVVLLIVTSAGENSKISAVLSLLSFTAILCAVVVQITPSGITAKNFPSVLLPSKILTNESINADAQCIESAKAAGLPLQRGLAEYWQTRAVEYSTAGTVNMTAVLNNLEPFFWMSSLADVRSNEEQFNWVLFEKSGSRPFDFSTNAVGTQLPKPSNVIQCTNGNEIWFWSNGELNSMIQAKFMHWLQVQPYISNPSKYY